MNIMLSRTLGASRGHHFLRVAARALATNADPDYYLRAAQADLEQLQTALREEKHLATNKKLSALPYSGKWRDAIFDVREQGVALLDRCINAKSALALRAFCLEELTRAQEHPTGYDDNDERAQFSAVLGAGGTAEAIAAGEDTRWDLRLPLSPPVRKALREVLKGPLGEAVEELVGNDAELHELACAISAPGAAPQVMHADAEWSADASLFTAFVALQDVKADMGPTCFLRRTHLAASAHAAFDANGAAFLAAADARLALLRIGDATLYDRRLLHAGGSNRSESADDKALRLLFYFTFNRKGAVGADLDNAHSIRHEYRGRGLTLKQLRDPKFKAPPVADAWWQSAASNAQQQSRQDEGLGEDARADARIADSRRPRRRKHRRRPLSGH